MLKNLILFSVCLLFSQAYGLKLYNFPSVEKLPIQTGMPDPFLKPDGTRVSSVQEWPAQREYLKSMLANYLYGTMPPRPKEFEVKLVKQGTAFDGKAVQSEYGITLKRNGKSLTFHFEVIRPVEKKRVPGIIKNCRIFFEYDGENKKGGATANYDKAAALKAVSRGYLLCKFKREELVRDNRGVGRTGIFELYPEYDWGVIAAWSWGHAVVVDALDKLELLDMERIVVTGHSRGGKTALCAGIYDERVTITAPNSSGTGGTGSLRYFQEGQKEQRISAHKGPHVHWWHPRFFEFEGKEDKLPYDAHFAKAVIAPRALFNAHAQQDYWANPYGTELTFRAADKVFQWLGAKDQQGLHWRKGGHAQNNEDWDALLQFADWKFLNIVPKKNLTTLTYPDTKLPLDWEVPVSGDQ